MLSNPIILEVPLRLTASIRLRVPRSEIRTVMGPGIQELMATLAAQRIVPTGPWYTHHFQEPKEVFDFEICVPISQKVEASGRVTPGAWPAMKVAQAIYSGPYEGLGDAWGQFKQWMDKQKLAISDELYECYLAGPESGNDSSKWRTELNRPLVP